MTQQRWFCTSCKREWVHARLWDAGQNCPACGAPPNEVERRQYAAAFPGADIATSPADVALAMQVSDPVEGVLAVESPAFTEALASALALNGRPMPLVLEPPPSVDEQFTPEESRAVVDALIARMKDLGVRIDAVVAARAAAPTRSAVPFDGGYL